jgi:hypothetical protein
MPKLSWSGTLQGVQPRIDLGRSFDERYHSYLGYLLVVQGEAAGEPRTFTVRIGPAAQAKHAFRAGDVVSGFAQPPIDAASEVADFYKASGLKLVARSDAPPSSPPPWLGEPPELGIYRERGHRRLDPRTYDASCRACQWGCRMAVTMIIDQWNPGVVERRFETFCYGPKSCSRYRAGPARRVPGRKGMSYTEEDWVDEEATGHRGEDE